MVIGKFLNSVFVESEEIFQVGYKKANKISILTPGILATDGSDEF